MNRAGEAKQLAALLNQVEELAELGRTAQDEDPSRGEPAARQLQDRYLTWYSAALGALPEDLRGRFVEQYEPQRATLTPKIKQFVAKPRQPWVLYDSVPKFLKGHGRWQHSLKRSYEEPLLEQRRLLLEAKGRFGVNAEVRHTADRLTELFRRLPAALAILEREQRGRAGLTVADEYDLQRVVHALLRLHADDVEPEETTPRRAGGAPDPRDEIITTREGRRVFVAPEAAGEVADRLLDAEHSALGYRFTLYRRSLVNQLSHTRRDDPR